mgnify:CR=1 FL=1
MPYRDEIFSKAVRAGKRTYFFDVKTTKGNDLYLTITESKKKTNHDGKSHYEKHKIFLYKEDFESFQNALAKVSEFIIKEKGSEVISNSKFNKTTSDEKDEGTDSTESSFTEVDLEDLS